MRAACGRAWALYPVPSLALVCVKERNVGERGRGLVILHENDRGAEARRNKIWTYLLQHCCGRCKFVVRSEAYAGCLVVRVCYPPRWCNTRTWSNWNGVGGFRVNFLARGVDQVPRRSAVLILVGWVVIIGLAHDCLDCSLISVVLWLNCGWFLGFVMILWKCLSGVLFWDSMWTANSFDCWLKFSNSKKIVFPGIFL